MIEDRIKNMSEKTAHLLKEFESLPTAEKEVFTVELLAHARAQELPVPLYVERALHPHAGGVTPTLSPAERAAAFRSWAERPSSYHTCFVRRSNQP
jgi:hypothetical protein